MAAVLSPNSLSFPHNILHDPIDLPRRTMDRYTPPRPSLPSISSLIEDVDKHVDKAPSRSPTVDRQRRTSAGSHSIQPPTPDRASFAGSPRNGFSPTPPLPGASSFDFPSRTTIETPSSTTNGQTYNGYFSTNSATTNPENYMQQRYAYPPLPDNNSWSYSGSPKSSRRPSEESSFIPQDVKRSPRSAYPDPPEPSSPYPGLVQQRPLPANFPPTVPSQGQSLPPIDPQMAVSQHQHHHHYPAANTPSYPQCTVRYQCPTCQKAFSRPSSLKIHTYSHTGEKPFKCKYEGCGKYFSVRSNMKRHEKGCHGIDSSSAGGNSPKAS